MPVRLFLVCLLLFSWHGTSGAAPSGRLAPAKGMLLVAAEGMTDQRFARAVVLLISHDERGASGVIVNHPTVRTLGDALGNELDLRGNQQPLYYGGPVADGAVTCLLRGTPPAMAIPVANGLSLLRVERVVPQLKGGAGENQLRVISGYAGWSIRQLAGEIARGDWYVIPADSNLLFDTPPEKLWEILRNRGHELWI